MANAARVLGEWLGTVAAKRFRALLQDDQSDDEPDAEQADEASSTGSGDEGNG